MAVRFRRLQTCEERPDVPSRVLKTYDPSLPDPGFLVYCLRAVDSSLDNLDCATHSNIAKEAS